MEITGCTLKHIYREGNKVVANKLANMGVDQDHKWVSHISPPETIISLFEADMRGVAFSKGCNVVHLFSVVPKKR